MAAPKGNQFWKARSKHGRDKIFADAKIMWEACQEYFEWVDENPLLELKAFSNGERAELPKMRAMTIGGLCIFLDITPHTWYEYAKNKDFTHITTRVEEIIRQQKFAGAAADLLNPNIIARDLGLKDKSERAHTGPNGGPVQVTEVEWDIQPVKPINDVNEENS